MQRGTVGGAHARALRILYYRIAGQEFVMILEGKNLTFAYEKRRGNILTDVSLRIDSRECTAILGPSGFGKTTLCKILSGYLRPQFGEVLLDGQPLPKKGYCPVQMVWQHPERAVNPRLRMRETLADGQQIEERIVRELGIEDDWMNRYPQELSGGELQRFCIARALGKDTKFLIADEISTMLDMITQSQIWNFLLKETRERGIGLVIISHSEALLSKVAARRITF